LFNEAERMTPLFASTIMPCVVRIITPTEMGGGIEPEKFVFRWPNAA
jgi:hypothetical protein